MNSSNIPTTAADVNNSFSDLNSDASGSVPSRTHVTIARLKSGVALTKEFKLPSKEELEAKPNEKFKETGYPGGQKFTHEEKSVASFDEFLAVVEEAREGGVAALIQGQLIASIKPGDTFERAQANFRDLPTKYFLFDVEGLPFPAGIDKKDIAAVARYTRSQLPSFLSEVKSFWYPSAKYGLSEDVRFHVGIEVSQPTTLGVLGKVLQPFFINKSTGTGIIDGSTFQSERLLYLVAPIFKDMPDPIEGLRGAVIIDGAPTATIPQAILDGINARAKGSEKFEKRIGTFRGTPPEPREMVRLLQFLLSKNKNFFAHYRDVYFDKNGRIVGVGWFNTSCALERAYGEEVGYTIWSGTFDGTVTEKAALDQWEKTVKSNRQDRPETAEFKIGSLIFAAEKYGFTLSKTEMSVDEFYAHLPTHKYIYTRTNALWPAVSLLNTLPPMAIVDQKGEPVLDENGEVVKVPVHIWLDQNQHVQDLTWAPGEPLIIKDKVLGNSGWTYSEGAKIYNLYKAPGEITGDPKGAGKWLQHIKRIYPGEAEDIIDWCAFKVQNPGIKINHGLVLGGPPGVGKDTLLEPVLAAVGHWNVSSIRPMELLESFNDFYKAVIVIVNECHDLGETNRYTFHDRTKTLMAAPPAGIRINEKFTPQYHIPNICGAVLTTNHRTGLYIPADDRRHLIAWAEAKKEDFPGDYWIDIWNWYDNGGRENVAAFLMERDLSNYNPKAYPKQTDAWRTMVAADQSSEDMELADLIEGMGNPPVFFLSDLADQAIPDGSNWFQEWLLNPKNRRAIGHKLEGCGYTKVENPGEKQGRWKVKGKNRVAYGLTSLTNNEKISIIQKKL